MSNLMRFGLSLACMIGCGGPREAGFTATLGGFIPPAEDTSSSTSGYSSTFGEGSSSPATSEWTSGPQRFDMGGDGSGGDCADFEPNGVQQIYCTEPSKAPPWTLGFGDWERRTHQFGDVSGSGKDTEVSESGQVRMGVFADADMSDCEGLEDHQEALARGYMCSPNDWYNYEITGYFQLVDAAGDEEDQDWTLYGGGGRHTGNGSQEGCTGTAYKGSYHYVDGAVRFGKEQWHVNYDYRNSWEQVPAGVNFESEPQRWLGMKLVRYEFERGGERGIRNELWLDLGGIDAAGNPANEWKLARVEDDHPDQGSWGEDGGYCNAPDDDQIMFWGGPLLSWRWDDTAARLRLMSAREIVAPKTMMEPP